MLALWGQFLPCCNCCNVKSSLEAKRDQRNGRAKRLFHLLVGSRWLIHLFLSKKDIRFRNSTSYAFIHTHTYLLTYIHNNQGNERERKKKKKKKGVVKKKII
ncbi:hypothetical protein TWF225_010055 [Orbilia oligospora]|nr:hypothetical protein TWF225_010055 [Orbilia oligospora]KAF3243293.1 hypothetical protein TWF128_010270 [Orbilia oligospora]KAF3250897.1 hypothetical protein TWF217_008506 [Orbilia oligospora]